VASAPCDLRHPPFENFCGDPAQINGVWVVPWKSGAGKWQKTFDIDCGSPCVGSNCKFTIAVWCTGSGGWRIDVYGESGLYLEVVIRKNTNIRLCCKDGAPYGGGDFTDGWTCQVHTWDGSFTISAT